MSPPINIGFWTEFYRTGEDPDSTYHKALAEHDDVLARAEVLWDWKDLSRGVKFETIRPALETLDMDKYCTMGASDAVSRLGSRLVETGALANTTVVTPAFILHLAASGPDSYSVEFPIFDARVWVAYTYLKRHRTGEESLPVAATSSATKYGAFVDFFKQTLPTNVDARTYERALFRFGAYIGSLPVGSVGDIDSHLSSLEQSIGAYEEKTGQALSKRE